MNGPFGFVSDGDDDFPLSVSFFQIPDGLGTSLSEYVLSMTGVILPASRSSFKTTIWFFLSGIEKFGVGIWLTNGESATSLRTRGMLPNQRPAPCPKRSCPMST